MRIVTAARRCLLALCLLTLAAACGDDDGDGGGSDAGDLSTYGSVSGLAEDLSDAGLTCTLEYEGLQDGNREVSLCTLEGELAELSVWADPVDAATTGDRADEDDDPLVVGENWTIDVQTAGTAETVAEALGGVARGL